MNRPLYIWAAFAACLALVLGSMGFVSLTVMRLDSDSAAARRQAALEENVRLALWRMDSTLSPLVGRENARPAHAFRAFYPARRAYTKMYALLDAGDVQVPSPLLTERYPHVRLHFQFAPGGSLTSPQAPAGNMRDLAESGFASHEAIVQASGQLRELESLIDREALVSAVGAIEPAPLVAQKGIRLNAPPQGMQMRNLPVAQQELSANEWQARSRTAFQAATIANAPNVDVAATELRAGLMQPIWQGGELLLVRRAELGGRRVVQGCWLDWPAIRAELLADVTDLLPGAALEPLVRAGQDRQVRRLAALPVELIPGAVAEQALSDLSPIQISLLVAWAFALLAAFAVGAVLRATVRLSERRAAFVSAVTHELRTPLTTFRMYTEMLAEGMVTDEAKLRDYYQTLHAEADRLDHLVQNVLAYARLEKNSGSAGHAQVALAEVLDRVQDRLAERARQQDMQLLVQADPETLESLIEVDPEAIGRILFNLVDNACKYAASASDRRIHIDVTRSARSMEIHVRDHGPGVNPDQTRDLFRPFSKSAQAAAETAPGVGLGLALSRRLARKMGGDLVLQPGQEDGACFVLSLLRK